MCLSRTDRPLPPSSRAMHDSAHILSRPLAIVALIVVLPGCMVGPNYARPKVERPEAFKSLPTTQPAARMPAEWWRLFEDDELDRLVASANESNQDIRQAIARVD